MVLMEAPAWKEYINDAVDHGAIEHDFSLVRGASMVAEERAPYGKQMKFPYGIYFGSKIRDTVKEQVGCVVGIQQDYILVAFENGVEPRVMPVGAEGFDKGFFALA